jgi:hypothetical protein
LPCNCLHTKPTTTESKRRIEKEGGREREISKHENTYDVVGREDGCDAQAVRKINRQTDSRKAAMPNKKYCRSGDRGRETQYA